MIGTLVIALMCIVMGTLLGIGIADAVYKRKVPSSGDKKEGLRITGTETGRIHPTTALPDPLETLYGSAPSPPPSQYGDNPWSDPYHNPHTQAAPAPPDVPYTFPDRGTVPDDTE